MSIRTSLTMIVKNEAANLPACLASVQDIVDEIIVVDTGSTDQTKDIARQHGARVFDFAWTDSFAAARRRAGRPLRPPRRPSRSPPRPCPAHPLDRRTTTRYPPRRRRRSVTRSAGHAATYSYNAAGEMTSETDRDGRVRNFGYDAVGRETSETWLNSLGQAIYTATYAFDAAGRLTSASDASSSYSYGYDNANRLTSVDNLGTPNVPHVVLTYGYDGYNNRTSLTDNQNGSVSFGFDADHRLTSIGLSILSVSNATLNFNYDAVSRLTSLTRTPLTGDTISTTFGYDNDNRLTNLTHTDTTKSPALTLASYTYGYDFASRLTSYSGPDGSLNYGYDNDNQLTSVTGARSENFTYDHNGNRTMTGYTTGKANELTSDGVYNYTYDNEGNLSTQTQISNGSVTYYTWDYRNRLTQEQVKDSLGNVLSTETFTYDVNNNRIGMYNSVSGTTTWTVFDGANPYMDFNGTTLTERYLTNPQGLSQFYARVNGSGTVNWYLTDNINSIRQIVDTSGNVLDALTYSSFGTILSETNATNGDRFKFTGGAYDSITSDYQDGRRYETPADGRFVSQDPKGFGAGDANLYRYAFNAPTYRTDPSGLEPPDPNLGPIIAMGYYQTVLLQAKYGAMYFHQALKPKDYIPQALQAYHGALNSYNSYINWYYQTHSTQPMILYVEIGDAKIQVIVSDFIQNSNKPDDVSLARYLAGAMAAQIKIQVNPVTNPHRYICLLAAVPESITITSTAVNKASFDGNNAEDAIIVGVNAFQNYVSDAWERCFGGKKH